VRSRIRQAVGKYDGVPTTVKKRKLKWYGYSVRLKGNGRKTQFCRALKREGEKHADRKDERMTAQTEQA